MNIRYLCPLVLAGCLAAVSSMCFAQTGKAPEPVAKVPVIYVSNFEFNVATAQNDQAASRGLLGGALRGGLLRRHEDPQAQAQQLSLLMADTLTKDLKQAGIDARRVLPGSEPPRSGWNVRGMFLSVDQGNAARRAMIGFGAGHSSLQVAVAIDDLAKPSQPLLQEVAKGSGSYMPGAIIALNPYMIAAKFVLAGRDQQKAVKDAAKQIAASIEQRMRAEGSDTVAVHQTL